MPLVESSAVSDFTSLFSKLLLEELEVESWTLDSDSEADVEEAHLPCKISSLLICPCGVSEATFKEEESEVEVELEDPVVVDFPFELVSESPLWL